MMIAILNVVLPNLPKSKMPVTNLNVTTGPLKRRSVTPDHEGVPPRVCQTLKSQEDTTDTPGIGPHLVLEVREAEHESLGSTWDPMDQTQGRTVVHSV